MPWALSLSTISSSLSGFCPSSSSMIVLSFSFTASQLISSPAVLVVPPEKKRRSGNTPRGVWIHFSETARDTVATWMPSWSATLIIGSGRRNSGPRSKKSRWASTTARITRWIVLLRCSMLSMSQRALRTLLARNSFVFLSQARSFSILRYMPLM